MTADQVRVLIRARAAEVGTMRALARAWEVSPAYLSDVVNGHRAPGRAILRRLRLVRVADYVPAPIVARRRAARL